MDESRSPLVKAIIAAEQVRRDLPASIEELIPALDATRDARVTRCHGNLACIEMDDHGQGDFERVCSDPVATELVRRGLVRDARSDPGFVADVMASDNEEAKSLLRERGITE